MKQNLRFLMLALLCAVFSTTWGQTTTTYTLTITPDDFNGLSYGDNNGTHTKDAVSSDGKTYTVVWSSNDVMLNNEQLQFKKNTGNIYNITDLQSITSVNISGAGSTTDFSTYYGSKQQPLTVLDPGRNFFTVINAKSSASYCTTITIKFEITESTVSYDITAISNDEAMGTVSLSGSTITATPASGYRVSTTNPYTVTSGTATVSQDGNVFTVDATSDCTVQINFEAIPTYTATFIANGSVISTTEYEEGADITFPANPEDEDDYKFIGWTTAEISGTSTTAPTMVTSATMGTTAQNFYAVYALLTGGGESTTKICDFEAETNSDWTIDGPVRSKERNNTPNGSYSGKINSNNTYVTFGEKVNVTSFSFAFTRTSTNDNYNVYIETSEDNEEWTAAATYAMSSFNNGTFSTRTKTFDGSKALYVRFHCYNTTAIRYVDDVTITYGTPASYTDYCTTVNTKPSPELSYAQDSYLAILSRPNEFTTPELVNPHVVQGITYTSENPSVAEVNATGAVTLKAVGTTTITASFEGNDDYKAGTASYTLNVVDVPVTNFEPSGSKVKVGDKILIKYTGTVNSVSYAINNGEYTTVNTTNYQPIFITDEMVVDNKVTIKAYHTYIVDDNTTLTSDEVIVTYTVVNPIVTIGTPSSIYPQGTEEISVTLTATPEEATIYYTLDNTIPTTNSTECVSGSTITIPLSTTTTIKAIAAIENVVGDVISEATYTIGQDIIYVTSDVYQLVTDANTLQDGDKIIIVSESNNYKVALGKEYASSSSSNIKKVDISSCYQNDGTIKPTDDVRILTIKKDEEKWTLYYDVDNNKYLYTETNGNYLKMHESGDDAIYKSATITIEGDDSHADIVYYIESDKKREIQYNASSMSGIFACYLETQQPVKIYRSIMVDAITLKEGLDNTETINDNENNSVTVNLYRSLTAGMWNAICLPFAMNDTQRKALFGEGYELQEFTSAELDAEGTTQLNFSKVNADVSTVAGTPYIVWPTQSVQSGAVVPINGVTISSTEPSGINKNNYIFQGIYNPTALEDMSAARENILFIGANNQLLKPSANSGAMKGFRAYFILPTNNTGASTMSLCTEDNGVITSIPLAEVSGLFTNMDNHRVYSISGQYLGNKTEGLTKGIYIVNGRKFIVK